MKVEIRDARNIDELMAVEELQLAAWGFSEREVTPHSILAASQHSGGLVALAWHGGEPIGFVWSFPAYADGKLWHHSHMLAVRPEWRHTGVALALKRYQREWVLRQGIEVVTWTYDPLLTRNARFNLGKLGAYAAHYYPDFYGLRTGLYAGLPADRLLVTWELNHPRVLERLRHIPPPPAPEGAPLNETEGEGASLRPLRLLEPEDERIYLEVPPDIEAMKASDLELARAWRMHTREAFQKALAQGYRVVDLARREGRVYYQLERVK